MKTEDTSVETWMYLVEYKDQEIYDEFSKAFREDQQDYAELFRLKKEWDSLIVPNSHKVEVLIEKPEFGI